ncbi:unnamed protein product [Lupinus luteus]|uniref:Reverse transcriptase domain-containing protein n=1 Tax=Lupinus luteus TaxID=3873 RepID=A0AAV1XAX1_LUPLU
MLCASNSNCNRISSFRFLKMWLHHPGISEVVKDSWSQPVCGCPMFILSNKLKRLKMVLKDWNANVFGNLHQRVKEAWSNVDTIQRCINDNGPDNDLLKQESLAQISVLKALAMEEDYWKEKSRLNWQISGDRNTSFFHKVTKIRQVTKSMSIMKDGDCILTKQEDISNLALRYFTDIFASPNATTPNQLINQVVPNIILEEENQFLIKSPSVEEIKDSVFSLNADGAPGPDGFGGGFYQNFWDVVKDDVCNSVHQFFSQGWLLSNLNSNYVVLIPKSANADKMDDFRPIALANFQFKIISKILADRLAIIAARIVSPQQKCFIKNRHIQDCIFLTLLFVILHLTFFT